MARVIHELAALITSNPDRFVRGLDRAILKTKELGRQWATVARGIGTAATRITVAVTAVSALSIKRFAELERTMTKVGAVTNTLRTKHFAQLETAALKMGATTEFTANQAAQAMEQLGLAGFNTTEIISALPGTLQLATAAQIGIADSASIAAKTMKAFGFEAGDLGRINDTLVATFTRSNTNILQLAEALKPVGPVARAVGVSLEDTSAILAKMADAGFQGSLGGTALRNAFIRLAAPSSRAAKILRDLGVKAIDPLFTKLRKISKGMENAANENVKLAIAAELFGTRGGPAMLAVLAANVDELENFSQGLKDAAGIAERIQKAQLETLIGQFNLLKSAVDAVAIEVGKKLAPTFQRLQKGMKEWIDLNAADIATRIAGAMKLLAEFAVTAAKGLSELAPTFLEVFRAASAFMRPITEFMLAHPQLMGMLLALKITGLLGVTNAFIALTAAIWSTVAAILTGLIPAIKAGVIASFMRLITVVIPQLIGVFLALIGKTSLLSGKMVLLSVALKAVIVIGLVPAMIAMTEVMGLFGKEASSAKEQLEQFDKVARGIAREGKKFRNRLLGDFEKEEAAELARAKEEAEKKKEEEDKKLPPKERIANRQAKVDATLKQIDADIKAQETAGRLLKPTLADAQKESDEAQAKTLGVGDRAVGAVIGLAGQETSGKVALDLAKATTEKRLQIVLEMQNRIENNLKDLRRKREFEEKKGAQNVSDFKIKLMDEEQAKQDLLTKAVAAQKKEAAAKLAREQKGVESLVSGAELSRLEERFPGLGTARTVADKGSRDQLFRFFQTRGGKAGDNLAAATQAKAAKGQDREAILRRALAAIKAINEEREKEKQKIEQTKAAMEANKATLDGFADAIQRLSEEGQIGDASAKRFAKRIAELRKQLDAGKLNSDDFKNALRDLNNEQQRAIQMQKEKEAQERRQRMLRLIRGKGSQSDREFLREQQQAARLARFDARLQSLFNNTFGLNRTVQTLNKSFRNAGRHVERFGQRINQAAPSGGGGGGGGQAPTIEQAFANLSRFLGSRTGQMIQLQNQIALLQNSMGLVDTFRSRRRIARQIDFLQQQIAQLRRLPPPPFVGLSGDGPFFADPGLVGGAGRGLSGGAVNIVMNVSERLTPGDAANLLNMMNLEIQRTGTPRVF